MKQKSSITKWISKLQPHHMAWLMIALLISGLWVRYSAHYITMIGNDHPPRMTPPAQMPVKPTPNRKEQHLLHSDNNLPPPRITRPPERPPQEFLGFLRAWHQLSRAKSIEELLEQSQFKTSPGVLAVFSLLSHQNPLAAWGIFSTFCIIALGASLILGFRYQTWRSVGLLLIGLLLAWNGFMGSLGKGELEILILAIAVASAACLARFPFLAGLLLGSLPWFKLPWMLLVFPFILMLHTLQRRFRLFFSGYLLSWFIWGAVIPSLILGPEQAVFVSQKWFKLIEQHPATMYLALPNQSLWMMAIRMFSWNIILALGVACVVGGYVLGRFTIRTARTTLPTQNVFVWLSPWLVLNQVLTPLSWRWGSIFLLGMPFSIYYSIRNARARALVWVPVLLLWLIQMNWFIKFIGFGMWNELYLYGYVAFFWLVMLVLAS